MQNIYSIKIIPVRLRLMQRKSGLRCFADMPCHCFAGSYLRDSAQRRREPSTVILQVLEAFFISFSCAHIFVGCSRGPLERNDAESSSLSGFSSTQLCRWKLFAFKSSRVSERKSNKASKHDKPDETSINFLRKSFDWSSAKNRKQITSLSRHLLRVS